jgi:hypothetical protein
MSQHSQRTQIGPSRLSIVLGWVAVAVTIGLVSRILGRPDLDGGHVIGAALGIVLGALLVAQTVARVGDRILAQDRVRRAAERAARQEERTAALVTGETGTWRGDSVGEVLTVRYEAATATYHVRGWLGDHWQLSHEMPWTHPGSLASHLAELEAGSELRPEDDEGTRAIRARLMLPGWDGSDPAATAVIEMTDAGLPRRAVGETLRPINTAVFRTEAERAAWADDMTQPIPRQS